MEKGIASGLGEKPPSILIVSQSMDKNNKARRTSKSCYKLGEALLHSFLLNIQLAMNLHENRPQAELR
jgi:hypothetical protein